MYVDPDNAEELANAIRLILENNTLRSEMQDKGYQHALNFREDIIADNLMKVYRKVF
jgi:glycosyltransferase involved in cell wall biosynthesis